MESNFDTTLAPNSPLKNLENTPTPLSYFPNDSDGDKNDDHDWGFDNVEIGKFPGVVPFTKTLPQIAQLEIKYRGPLVKDSVVEKLEDLTKIDTISFNYQHRRIWVKEYAGEYYLDHGNGSELHHWKRAISRMVVNLWEQGENYQKGDIVCVGGKLFYAKLNIHNSQLNPFEDELSWEVCTGDVETYRYTFNNLENEYQIWTEIKNPIFEVCLGIPRYASDGQQFINPETKLVDFKNIEVIEACIIQGVFDTETGEIIEEPDEPIIDNGDYEHNQNWRQGGVPYIIRLYTNELTNRDKYYTDTVDGTGIADTDGFKTLDELRAAGYHLFINIK